MNSKPVEQMIAIITGYKNSRRTVKPFNSQYENTDFMEMSKYLRSTLHMASFIFEWDKTQISK